MKTIKFFGAILLLSIAVTGCKKGGIFCYRPDGNTTEQVRDVSGFNAIDLSIAATVNITHSEDYAVKVKGSKNLLDILETKVKGNKLKIDFKKNKCVKEAYDITLDIAMPNLSGINISGSGDIYVPTCFSGTDLEINISGSGSLAIDSLAVESLDCDISGSGSIDITGIGTATKEKIKISGSGDIYLFDFPVHQSDINISGSGNCNVHVLDELDVNISGSGDIVYMGDPTVIQNISGSGSVRPY